MTFDREMFFDQLKYETMRPEHIELLKEISKHVDDDTLSKICIEYLSSEHDSVEVLANMIENIVDDAKSEQFGMNVNDFDLKESIKDGFDYICSIYDIGAEDIAIDMLNDVADALRVAQSSPYFGTDTGFLKELEDELRECLGSDDPLDWFEYVDTTSSEGASAGALNMYHSIEHIIPEELKGEFLALASDGERTTEFVRFFKDNVSSNLDTYLEIVLSYNAAVDICIGDLLDSEFDDEDEAYAHILKDESLTFPYLQEEFTNAFSFLIFMDKMGMHEDAMELLKGMSDDIDELIDDTREDHEPVVPCFKDLGDMIKESIGNDDVTAWMDDDMLQLHTLLFDY